MFQGVPTSASPELGIYAPHQQEVVEEVIAIVIAKAASDLFLASFPWVSPAFYYSTHEKGDLVAARLHLDAQPDSLKDEYM